MAYRRGSVYLAKFNPAKGSEPGKVRPCVVIQTDDLNTSIHRTVTVLPFTTQLLDNALPMRVTIKARDKLEQNSQVMIDQIQTVDVGRFTSDTLTTLNENEMRLVEESLRTLLVLEN